jgi:FkbM family methyltransferase
MALLKNLKRKVPPALGRRIKNLVYSFDINYKRSYSQEGEDMILFNLFRKKEKGFYIDIGAHHPKFFSNTYFFYSKGWEGINIDAMPGSMDLFNKQRPRDINLELAISNNDEVLKFFAFDPPALNTFSVELAAERKAIEKFKFIFEKEIRTVQLYEVLEQYIKPSQEIDFLTIDVEGLDLQVLLSNNWSKYRPKVILVESLGFSLEDFSNDEVYLFLTNQGYKLFSKTINTLFFIEKDFYFEIY